MLCIPTRSEMKEFVPKKRNELKRFSLVYNATENCAKKMKYNTNGRTGNYPIKPHVLSLLWNDAKPEANIRILKQKMLMYHNTTLRSTYTAKIVIMIYNAAGSP